MSTLTDGEWAAIMGAPTPDPAEAWCDRCDQPTAKVIETTTSTHYLCWKHASDLNWKMRSPACNSSRKAATR